MTSHRGKLIEDRRTDVVDVKPQHHRNHAPVDERDNHHTREFTLFFDVCECVVSCFLKCSTLSSVFMSFV